MYEFSPSFVLTIEPQFFVEKKLRVTDFDGIALSNYVCVAVACGYVQDQVLIITANNI
jgi:hypothetical protein